ncbi:MAG: riboflavin synthase [Planctomycetota bacterium]|nr:riboflavin synthase [Planctomycetota bacterium]MDA1212829.1 riboflavin synthase [Planctomycetota bacterium]
MNFNVFTGLVEGMAVVVGIAPEGTAVRLTIELPPELCDDAKLGDSICLNGCCLTVVAIDGRKLSFEAGAETLAKTNLGQLKPGDRLNVERSLPVDGRLGGHVVQGHVEGTARVAAIRKEGEWVTMQFTLPDALLRFVVPKGSIAIDGVSLTVVDVVGTTFGVMLIPHTLEATTLGQRNVGDPVNIETDILARYVERLLTPYLESQ